MGPAFVSLGVGLILFQAGLRLRVDELEGGARRVVMLLIPIGVVVTAVGVPLAVRLLFGLGWGTSAMIGAILVVSGPTVVLPLLAFVRPTERVRTILKWEGVLIDPFGALLGVITFTAVLDSAGRIPAFHPEEVLLSVAVGLARGLLGAALLWALLKGIQRASPKQSVAAALMVVTAALVGADLIREDSGFVAATVMGMVLANQRTLDLSNVLEFEGTVVQLLIECCSSISASVKPSTVSSLLPEGVALIAVMVLVIRPLVVALGTYRSPLSRAERTFMGWLAPRGIVAAATASAFGPALAKQGSAVRARSFRSASSRSSAPWLCAGLLPPGSPVVSNWRVPVRRSAFLSSSDTPGRARLPGRSGKLVSGRAFGPGRQTSRRP